MSNSFNLSDKPEILANLVQILSNASALATIQVTDLPGIVTEIDANQVFIEAIIDTHLPGIITEINANETKIDAIINNHIPGTNAKVDVNLAAIDIIDGIVDAIKLKTDATPQNVRGNLNSAHLSTSDSALQTVVSVTGHGKVYSIGMRCFDGADTVEIKITIDGTAFGIKTHTGDILTQSVLPDILAPEAASLHLTLLPTPLTEPRLFNFEFDTSLLIEIRRSAGTAGNVACQVYYNIDAF